MTAKYTVSQIMKWKLCYTLDRVEDLIGDGLSATGLADLDIPESDVVWVLICMLYDIKDKYAVADFAGNCALRAYYHADSACADPRRRLLNDAKRAAAYADYAAYATYYAAYAAAAYATAYAAAYAADAAAAIYAAAAHAAYCTAYAAERQWQIDYLIAAINSTYL